MEMYVRFRRGKKPQKPEMKVWKSSIRLVEINGGLCVEIVCPVCGSTLDIRVEDLQKLFSGDVKLAYVSRKAK
jgi:hypothetical protein